MRSDKVENLHKLIFATSNVVYLRGLAMLPVGLTLTAFPFLGHWSTAFPGLAGIAAILLFVAAFEATRRINQFYNRHYGEAEPIGSNAFPLMGMAVWGGIFWVICVFWREPHFSLAALWLAAFFWGIYMSSSGYRWHYLVLTACFASLVPWWNALGESWTTVILGATFAVAGLMDHRLLVRMLPVAKGDGSFSVA